MVQHIEIFPWNDNFSTHIEVIDAQHKRLVELLNVLVSHLAFQSDAPALSKIVEELKAYTVEHFATEEGIWGQYFNGDAWEQWHRDAHVSFVDKVVDLTAHQTDRPYDAVIEDIVGFLTHWLALHIIESDKRMAKVVLALPSGLSLEQAKELANQEMTGATRALIDTVMGMYDNLATRTIQLTREISRRVKADAELQAAQEELTRLKNEAVAANRAKSVFLADMSHEIRTPMNAILGLSYVLRQEVSDAGHKAKLDNLTSSAKHLLNLVNDILDISKIEAGSLLLEEANLNIQDALGHVTNMMGNQASEKKLQLMVEIDPAVETMPLLGDPLRIEQILVNYVSNALKFTERGRIVVRARLEDQQNDRATVRFEVEDSGIGIPSEAQARIFDAYEQADTGTSRKFGGTGLGLSIAKRFATLMGGKVGVTSQPGQGSTFWFTAVLQRGSVKETVTQAAGKVLRQGASVLLVEDEELNQDIARIMLESFGLVVDVANHGAEALDKTKNRSYDLILMDMQMPVMDGLEATRNIRAMGMAMPILAMSGNVFRDDREKCVVAGMNDFIPKPVDPVRLKEVLAKWIPER